MGSKITILIPTYRRFDLLKEALQSAIDQTAHQESYEILVVDNDPSLETDTERLINSIKVSNLRYVKNRHNLGGYGNWNRGFELTQTEWVCLLHDDDLLLPSCIRRAQAILAQFETPRLGAIIPRQCNLYDNSEEEAAELLEKSKSWKARLDNWMQDKTVGRLWRISLFDNYMISSAYPALSGGNLLRRDAILELGAFGTKWPCEDIFLMNRLARKYDCFLLGEQWGWYRFGTNNMWSKPSELVKWDQAKKLFREGAARADGRCRLYHTVFGRAMCVFDRDESIRFAKRRGTDVSPALYTWIMDASAPLIVRMCRWNRNVWHVWMSVRAILFGKHVKKIKSEELL